MSTTKSELYLYTTLERVEQIRSLGEIWPGRSKLVHLSPDFYLQSELATQALSSVPLVECRLGPLALLLTSEEAQLRTVEPLYSPDGQLFRLGGGREHSIRRTVSLLDLGLTKELLLGVSFHYTVPSQDFLLIAELPVPPLVVEATWNFDRILNDAVNRPYALLDLTNRQFEELVAELWKRFGYDVELTKKTRDGGADVIAVSRREANVKFLIECKRWNPQNKVGVSLVRALYGVKVHQGATKAILATTSSFTREAREIFTAHRWELEPRDYDGVMDWVRLAIR
jgi:hypothetical protein